MPFWTLARVARALGLEGQYDERPIAAISTVASGYAYLVMCNVYWDNNPTRFWWHSAGYTPAGVEAWNGIRANGAVWNGFRTNGLVVNGFGLNGAVGTGIEAGTVVESSGSRSRGPCPSRSPSPTRAPRSRHRRSSRASPSRRRPLIPHSPTNSTINCGTYSPNRIWYRPIRWKEFGR